MARNTAWLVGLVLVLGCGRTPTSSSIEVTSQPTAPTSPTTETPDPLQRQVEALRSQGNLGKIGFGFKVQNGLYPAGYADEKGKPLLSWRVALLPMLGHDELFRKFKFNEPWDSEHNKKLLALMPEEYRPVRGQVAPGHTYYRVFTGPDAVFPAEVKPSDTITLLHGQRCHPMLAQVSAAQIGDGVERTLLVVEGGEAVPWTKPDELLYDKDKPLPKLGGQFEGDFNVLFADMTSVRLIPQSVKENLIRAAITPTGGEKLEPADFGPPAK